MVAKARKSSADSASQSSIPPDTAAEDAEKLELLRQLESLQVERNRYKTIADSASETKRLLQEAQAAVALAKARYEEADAARKMARAAVDDAIANELMLVARWTSGEQLLPFPPADDTTETPSTKLDDPAAMDPIDVLSAKKIARLIGKDECQRLKDIGEPVGLGPSELEILIENDLTTIGLLEERMRTRENWYRDIPGFGESKINKLINTLRVYRQKFPQPMADEATPSIDAPPATAPEPETEDWEQSVYHLKEILHEAETLIEAAEGFSRGELTEIIGESSGLIQILTAAKTITQEERQKVSDLSSRLANHRK